jgi:hypothetical protein
MTDLFWDDNSNPNATLGLADCSMYPKNILRSRDRFGIAMNGADHCLILGFATEYSTSVRKFTATYVNPIARMQPWTR